MGKRTLLILCQICLSVVGGGQCNVFAGTLKGTPVLPSKLESTKLKEERDVLTRKCCTNYDDIQRVYKYISSFRNVPQRDEFETTDQYSKKIELYKDIESKIEKRCYLFLLDTNFGWSRYNADERTMSFGINYPGAVLLKSESVESSYVGENAYGVKKVIKKIEELKYTVSFTNSDRFKIITTKQNIYEIPVGALNIDVENAKLLKNRYAIAVLARPSKVRSKDGKSGYFKGDYYRSSPTIDLPYDRRQTEEQFNAELLAAIVIDTSSGKVLKYKSFDGDTGCIDNYEIK